MKKILAFTLSVIAVALLALPAEAKSIESFISPAITGASQRGVQISRHGHFNHRVRIVTRTRIVRFGRRVYRETYRVRYLPNGRIQTSLVSRVRIR